MSFYSQNFFFFLKAIKFPNLPRPSRWQPLRTINQFNLVKMWICAIFRACAWADVAHHTNWVPLGYHGVKEPISCQEIEKSLYRNWKCHLPKWYCMVSWHCSQASWLRRVWKTLRLQTNNILERCVWACAIRSYPKWSTVGGWIRLIVGFQPLMISYHRLQVGFGGVCT